MSQTAKIFINGRSQAVRLPSSYRFNCKEVFIRRDKKTGNVILSQKPDSWDGFLELLVKIKIPDDFLLNREDSLPQERALFDDE
jgi:antitoxin VapB